MESNFNNIIDLISIKQYKLRILRDKKWNTLDRMPVSNTEWGILALAHGKHPTISEIAQQMGISRQAAHKCINALNKKGLICINNALNNNRNKCVHLTLLGENYLMENLKLKEEIEKELELRLGSENINFLKELLKKEWN